MNLVKTVKAAVARVATFAMQKSYGAGSWFMSGGSFKGFPMDWWQKDMTPAMPDYETYAPVVTCVNIISQDMSRIPLVHLQVEQGQMGATRIYNKAPARVFRKPNKYQSRSDWMLYMLHSLLTDGNAYCFATRNNRNEIDALYPLHPTLCWPYIEPTSGEIFYKLGEDATTALIPDVDTISAEDWYTPREILHIRLQTPRHPLVGESPLKAALYSTLTGTEINKHLSAFFHNMSRPSGYLRHPGDLDENAMVRIKERWKELTTGPNTGEPAILREGMDWNPITMSAVDSDIVNIYNMTTKQVLQVYRIPEFLAGDLSKATLNNVESLTRWYISSCLGFYIDHVEEALTLFFNLPPNEQIHFDLEGVMLRGNFKERMEALGKGVQNGIYAPNEARAMEQLGPVENGEEPRVQQQLVPLSWGMNLDNQPAAPSTPAPANDVDDDDMSDEEKANVIYLHAKSQMG